MVNIRMDRRSSLPADANVDVATDGRAAPDSDAAQYGGASIDDSIVPVNGRWAPPGGRDKSMQAVPHVPGLARFDLYCRILSKL
jgi:hypothetical protein